MSTLLWTALSNKHTHIISYDLNYPYNPEIYKTLDKKIQSLGSWAKPLNTFWLLKSDSTTELIKNSLVPIIQNQWKLIVVSTRTWNTASYWFLLNELQLKPTIPMVIPRRLSEMISYKK